MWKKKLIIAVVVGIVSCMSVCDAFGRGVVVGSHGGRRVATAPDHGRRLFAGTRQRRRHTIAPRHSANIVVSWPRRRQVFFDSCRTVVVSPYPSAIAQNTLTVWITNSNGSQTPVTLKQQGPYYIGPSGEYYPAMPTQEQLRVLYGL